MKRNISIVGMLCTLLLTACRADREQHPAQAIPVEVACPQKIQQPKSFQYVGRVESNYSSSLSLQVGGEVAGVYFQPGQWVNQGDLLVALRAENLKSSHHAALATLRQAQDSHRRLSKLYQKRTIPEIQWVEVKTKLQQAESMEAIAAKNLQQSELRAPFSGIVGERLINPGENVALGLPVLTLLNMDEVKVKIAVPEGEIREITSGQVARITFASNDTLVFEARVAEKSLIAHPISHTYEVKCQLQEQATLPLLPGMVCTVAVLQDAMQSVYVVPAHLVQTDYQNNPYLWIDQQGKAYPQPIELGELTEQGVVVRSGMDSTTQIIVAGWHKLSHGSNITRQ